MTRIIYVYEQWSTDEPVHMGCLYRYTIMYIFYIIKMCLSLCRGRHRVFEDLILLRYV